jgi:hypothetical protein
MAKKATPAQPKIQLLVSDEAKPAVSVEPGMLFEVVSVPLVDPSLRTARPVGARLCGGTSTCIALVHIEAEPK